MSVNTITTSILERYILLIFIEQVSLIATGSLLLWNPMKQHNFPEALYIHSLCRLSFCFN
ncbi:hypothetical protein CW304_18510 [Bacillus sp. UFRGS-B20]|nr:hypothetical protein CW304_18510 [Bacillus sp. UFRGS-B20]